MLQHPTHADLYAWLKGCPIHNWIDDACSDDLAKLCALVDQQPSNSPPRIGLELHHSPSRKTDASFFGDSTLLQLPGVSYPNFALEWQDYLANIHPNNPFSKDIVVEFDHSLNGYKLMGLFQRCQPYATAINPILNLVEAYAESRQEELKTGNNSCFRRQSFRMLKQNFDAIGPPTCLGFLERNSAVVKVITQIEEHNKNAAIQYLLSNLDRGHHFGASLIANHLQNSDCSTKTEQQVRLSLDYDIHSGRFLERYALELVDRQDVQKEGLALGTSGQAQAFNALEQVPGSARSLEIGSCLPYAEKRPHANLVCEEVLLAKHHHKKLIACATTASIKDYIILAAWSQP